MLNWKDEKLVIPFLAISATFLWVNFDALLGGLYTAFIILYILSLGVKIPPPIEIFSGQHSLLSSFVIAGIMFGIFILIAGLVINYIEPNAQFSLFSTTVLDKIAEKTQVPILSTNPTIRLVVYGIFVPIAETLFALSVVLMAWAIALKTPVEWSISNVKMYWVALLVGIVMAYFHLTTRQMSGFALITDAFFFSISALLVIYRKQLLDAMLFHIYLNTVALIR